MADEEKCHYPRCHKGTITETPGMQALDRNARPDLEPRSWPCPRCFTRNTKTSDPLCAGLESLLGVLTVKDEEPWDGTRGVCPERPDGSCEGCPSCQEIGAGPWSDTMDELFPVDDNA